MVNIKSFKWASDNLQKLSDSELIELASSAISDRTDLRVGSLIIENKKEKIAPKESFDLILKETEKRKIPLERIAQHFSDNAFRGNNFASNLVAPTNWKRYEIHISDAIVQLLKMEGIKLDKAEYDARILGIYSKGIRRIDLLLTKFQPKHIVACEFKDYHRTKISIDRVESFVHKIKDVCANRGVMVSCRGFQKSAINVAKANSIVLFVFSEHSYDEMLKMYPNRASQLKSDGCYWILKDYDDHEWVFEGKLTGKPIKK